jgi:cytochrome c553
MNTLRCTDPTVTLGSFALFVFFGATIAAENPPAGDATRGATIVTTCQACHGAHGEGVPATGGPRLAGQTADYLAAQLRAYADGSRANPIMVSIAKSLDAGKQADAAAFFAAQSAPHAAHTVEPSAEQLARGRTLVRVGDESKQLQACANCHGPDGSGERYATPYLAGQSATYLASAIREWKTGARHGGESQMGWVVQRLDDLDIAAVSAYLESLGDNAH